MGGLVMILGVKQSIIWRMGRERGVELGNFGNNSTINIDFSKTLRNKAKLQLYTIYE
jgi:hypothetical protein